MFDLLHLAKILCGLSVMCHLHQTWRSETSPALTVKLPLNTELLLHKFVSATEEKRSGWQRHSLDRPVESSYAHLGQYLKSLRVFSYQTFHFPIGLNQLSWTVFISLSSSSLSCFFSCYLTTGENPHHFRHIFHCHFLCYLHLNFLSRNCRWCSHLIHSSPTPGQTTWVV